MLVHHTTCITDITVITPIKVLQDNASSRNIDAAICLCLNCTQHLMEMHAVSCCCHLNPWYLDTAVLNRKIRLPMLEIKPWTLSLLGSYCTDWATTHKFYLLHPYKRHAHCLSPQPKKPIHSNILYKSSQLLPIILVWLIPTLPHSHVKQTAFQGYVLLR